ncbi:beta-1,6-N-acetylglucosaminyltransferase [Methylobacterium radiodurans]|nr:beta-1,6-N-acetylglucosaminyltransferase [Methylobacterium radiodurans]
MTAYFITCHASVACVRDQFRTLHRPEHLLLYHVDAKAPAALHETVRRLGEAFPNVVVLPSRHYAWAGYSQVATTLEAMDRALASGSDWSHLVVLSEQHCRLRDEAGLAAALEPGVSYVDATPFGAMNPVSQADIAHRFSMEYRELPGIGSFGIVPAAPDPEFLARLRHGSNWYILSRQACAYLRDAARTAPEAARLRAAVHPDENMLQTLLSADGGEGGRIETRETTFVAWPHISGNPDMTFRAEDFRAARAGDRLFIRKRPACLPPEVAAALEGWASLSEADLTAVIGAPPEPSAEAPDPEGTALARRVASRVVRRGRGVQADLPNLRFGLRNPSFSLRFRTARIPDGIDVRILSQDLRHFRVLLLEAESPAIDFVPRLRHGRPAPLLRIRVPEFDFRREILVEEDPARGFWTRPGDGGVIGLVRVIEAYIRVAEGLGAVRAREPVRGLAAARQEAAARGRSLAWSLRRLLKRKRPA